MARSSHDPPPHHPCGRLDARSRQELSRQLIDASAEVEVGRSAPEIRAGFVVHFESAQPDDLGMGGQRMVDASPAGRAATLTVRVMAGPWNAAMKAALFERLEAVMREGAGMPKQGNGADLWTTIVEVPESAWGLGGRAVSIERLAPVFDEERQARIRAHLEESD